MDTDELIVRRAGGLTIAGIFAGQGEAAFRDMESAVIAEVAGRDGQVIALGGGAILRPGNVAALRQNKKRADCVPARGGGDAGAAAFAGDPKTAASRPALTDLGGKAGEGAGSLEEVEAVLAVREPLYCAAADAVLDVTYLGADDAIYHLTRLL